MQINNYPAPILSNFKLHGSSQYPISVINKMNLTIVKHPDYDELYFASQGSNLSQGQLENIITKVQRDHHCLVVRAVLFLGNRSFGANGVPFPLITIYTSEKHSPEYFSLEVYAIRIRGA